MEGISGESLGNDTKEMFNNLHDGKFLCRLINMIEPNTIHHIIPHRFEPRANTYYFIKACNKLNICKYSHIQIELNKHYNLILNILYSLSLKSKQYGFIGAFGKNVNDEFYIVLFNVFYYSPTNINRLNKMNDGYHLVKKEIPFQYISQKTNLSVYKLQRILYHINSDYDILHISRWIKWMKYISLIQHEILNDDELNQILYPENKTIFVEYMFIDLNDDLSKPFKILAKRHKVKKNDLFYVGNYYHDHVEPKMINIKYLKYMDYLNGFH